MGITLLVSHRVEIQNQDFWRQVTGPSYHMVLIVAKRVILE